MITSETASAAGRAGRNWADVRDRLLHLRSEYEELEPDTPMPPPGPPASPTALDAAEARLGHALDRHHRELLAHADGWRDLRHTVDLLSADRLGEPGAVWAAALDQLARSQREGAVLDVPPTDELDVVGYSPVSDVLVLVRRGGPLTDGGNQVFWYDHRIREHGGESVHTWANLWEFLAHVRDEDQETVDWFREDAEVEARNRREQGPWRALRRYSRPRIAGVVLGAVPVALYFLIKNAIEAS